jgi:serine/threonine-protein kinase
VCDALEYAHQRGIVHRDIKPDNILLSGRRAMVSDFGVARAVTAASDDTLTGAGVTLGTRAYMAPEQFAGDRPDPRIDLYATGVMAFEMLAGERPFGVDIPLSRETATAGQVRDRLLELRPEVSPVLAGLVSRCLSARPDDRYRNAGEMQAELQGLSTSSEAGRSFTRQRVGIFVSAGAVLALMLAFLFWNRALRAPASSPGSGAPRLAVLVFQHGGNAALEPLAVGLTDNLIGALGSVPGLVVRSLSAVLPYRDSVISPEVLGRRLDVSWLVGGRVYQVENQRVASVELTEARSGRLIDRKEVGAPPGQDLRLIQSIVTQVATMLRERVGDEVRVQDWRAGTRSDAAFAAVLRAHQERREAAHLAALRDVPGAWLRLRRAENLLDSAGRADPRWVEPWIERAQMARYTAAMLFGSGQWTDSVPAVLQRGIAQAQVAERMQPNSARARELLGLLWFELANRDPITDSAAARRALAERLLRQVSEADTTLVDALTVLGTIHFGRGEYEQAYVTAERAYRADAYHRDPQEVLGQLYTYAFEAEEDAEAERWCAQYGTRFPDDWFTGYCRLELMNWASTAAADGDSAVAIATRAAANAPRVIRGPVRAQLRLQAAGALARSGRLAEAKRLLNDVRSEVAEDRLASREPFASKLLEIEAGVRLRLGDADTARALLTELLRRNPDRTERLLRSRRFRELSLDRAAAAQVR